MFCCLLYEFLSNATEKSCASHHVREVVSKVESDGIYRKKFDPWIGLQEEWYMLDDRHYLNITVTPATNYLFNFF